MSTFETDEHLRALNVCALGPSRVLGVKGEFLTVDFPHKLRAKFDRLFEFLFGLPL